MNFSVLPLCFSPKGTTIEDIEKIIKPDFPASLTERGFFMRSGSKNASYFDDDFEVTYEDEISFDYNTDNIDLETLEINRHYSYDDDFEEDDDYDDSYSDNYDYDNSYDDDDYYSDNYSDDRRYNGQKRRRRYRPTRLAAPIQKGGNAVIGIARTLIRNLTLFLMLAILILMGYTFLRGSTPYGDIENAVSTNTYTLKLTAYFSVAAAMILYEIISMLWAMTKARFRDEYGYHREDVGRGMFSFIFLYLCSYASFVVNNWIPESHEILTGLKGALDVFGSMHNALFGLCLAGVISCLFRKYSISL